MLVKPKPPTYHYPVVRPGEVRTARYGPAHRKRLPACQTPMSAGRLHRLWVVAMRKS